ncbi:LuxR C-terminal-related transcriptional regulator [Amycolatopsis aidingensis]|uniref:LuxR C-terminal-related transcriptional regulator n=1 Tax=Amycolatopsis aidingensis TaxID=2842453 RepID=UPI001C0E53B3|nr:LuxR C-terminal-related transcriptional regulator [Amycolatopsis aidingensis]
MTKFSRRPGRPVVNLDNLDDAERAIYSFLLNGPATKSDYASTTGLTNEKAAAALNQLQAHKFGRHSPADSLQQLTQSPDAAIVDLVKQLRAEYMRLSKQATSVNDLLDQLQVWCARDHDEAIELPGTEKLMDGEKVREKLVDLSKEVNRSVRALYPTISSPEALRAGYALDRAVLDRGVEIRAVFPHSARRQRDAMNYLRQIQEDGAEPRTAAALPTQLILLDDNLAILPMEPDCNGSAALVRDPSVLAFLAQLFEHVWDRARPISEYKYDQEVWRDIEIAILVELNCGRSDEAISRKLDISTRTLRRYLADLCDRFEVKTRFQLAVAASRAGLLPATKENQ